METHAENPPSFSLSKVCTAEMEHSASGWTLTHRRTKQAKTEEKEEEEEDESTRRDTKRDIQTDPLLNC